MERRLLLNVVVREGAAILELLSSKDQALLVRRDAFLVLDLGLDIVNGIRRLDIEGNGLSGEGFDENLIKRGKERVRHKLRLTVNGQRVM